VRLQTAQVRLAIPMAMRAGPIAQMLASTGLILEAPTSAGPLVAATEQTHTDASLDYDNQPSEEYVTI